MIEGTIIIVDTELGFRDRFKKKLEEEGVEEKFKVINLIPIASLKEEDLIENCLEQLENSIKLNENVIGIFVDMVIHETPKKIKEEDKEINYLGIQLATSIKARFPQIPTFNITAHEEKSDMLSYATLENLEGVFGKSFLEGETFSYSRLNYIFNKANQNISIKYKEKNDFNDLIVSAKFRKKVSIKYEYPDFRVIHQIMEIGENDFLGLLDSVFPDSQGTISYIKSGRSGAYVFKINTKFDIKDESKTKAKQWLVKVSRKAELIDSEVENYKKIEISTLPKTAFPKMYLDRAFSFGKLKGLAYEFEKDSKTLMEFLNNDFSYDYIKILKNEIYNILYNLYGDADKKLVYLWKNQYYLDSETKNGLLFFLDDYKSVLEKKVSGNILSTIKNLIQTQGESKETIYKFELEIDQRNIHGDFNAGNILINKKNNLVLLDFASFKKQGHITKDIAKLERDIIYKVVDASSPYYYDWSRDKVWGNFSKLYDSKDFFELKIASSVKDEKMKNYYLLIKSMRSILLSISPDVTVKEYLFSILYYTLLALVHPDISLHKKVYAIKNIDLILNQIDS